MRAEPTYMTTIGGEKRHSDWDVNVQGARICDENQSLFKILLRGLYNISGPNVKWGVSGMLPRGHSISSTHTSVALVVRGRSGFLFGWIIVPRCILHGIRRVSAQYTRVFDETSRASRLVFIRYKTQGPVLANLTCDTYGL